MASLFQIGTSGLTAAQNQLATTGHNIANVETPGYSRQRALQVTNTPEFSGAGWVGNGAHVNMIERQYDEFLVAQVRDTSSRLAASDVLDTQLSRLTGLLGEDATGLGPTIAGLFAALHDVAQHPTDPASRGALLSAANTLAGRVREIDGEMARLRKDANYAFARSIDEANTLIAKVAHLNDQIALASNAGKPPNDVLDQRDQLVRELGQLVRVNTFTQVDGTLNVYMGNGQALVAGAVSYRLGATPDPRFNDDLTLSLETAGGSIVVPYDEIGGGEVTGYLRFRDGALTGAQNELGRFAQALSTAFNEQHRLGQDRTGAAGGDFFAAGVPVAYSDARNTGTGIATATVVDPSLLEGSDYLVRWDGSNYSIRRMADGSTQTFATLPQTLDGVAIDVTGAPAPDDAFMVMPSRLGAQTLQVLIGDADRIAAAAPVRSTASTSNLGSGRISAPTVTGPAPDPNLTQPVTITFTGAGTFDVTGVGTGNPTGVAYTPGGTISFNGWTITLEGAPRVGDAFTVTQNAPGSADAGNMQRLAGLQTRQLIAGETLSAAYGSLVASVGNAANGAKLEHETHQRLVDNAEQAHQELSGVNLDEEAANLLRFQSAYQASARFIAIAGSLFDELLNAMR